MAGSDEQIVHSIKTKRDCGIMAGFTNYTQTKWKYMHVIFCNSNSFWWQTLLKDGFKHCFVIIEDYNGNYTFIDANCTNIAVSIIYNLEHETDLQEICHKQRCKILTIPTTKLISNKKAPLAFLTCVELVKRVLGIHKRSILTPYSLYKYIQKLYLL